MPTLHLNGFTFETLFTAHGLMALDVAFLAALQEQHIDLHHKLLTYRASPEAFTPLETSDLLIAWSKILEQFLAQLFHIEDALIQSQIKTTSHNPISVFKKYFVLKRAKKEINKADSFKSFAVLTSWLQGELAKAPMHTQDQELAIALLATSYLAAPDRFSQEIEQLVAWCVRALTTPEGQKLTETWGSFHLPTRIDHNHLVDTESNTHGNGVSLSAPNATLRHRDGFKLTDERMDERQIQDEINYCIYCHDHDGDFCSKGFPVKKGDPSQGFKKNPLDVTLTGCPLEEKISEMNLLKKEGHTIAALAMVMVDNPMCAVTGHRICNDCMKACIYQKQDPVNIPQIETRVVTDVLDLPWGVEIYDLLTRWNPLRQKQWVMKPYNGLKVLIAGMGPAGFTLAHHLTLEGFAVVGFDGLKIEPLAPELIHTPIHRFNDLKESLDERLMAGFGGVAEYGITVRWDKNFLKLIYLCLMRRPYFQVFGSVRFGGTLLVDDVWAMGFDHFAIAVGAGLPKALPIPNSLAPGMRQANDFLMALQLGNAAKASSLTNLQIRLPAVVIGGGLTGVDAATECQAYYITQVEKISHRYHQLVATLGEEAVHNKLDASSKEILAEFLRHHEAIKKERDDAASKNRNPNFIPLIREWGGVTIAYRRNMQSSPAYIYNHEEIQKALQEGIYYREGLVPDQVLLNDYGYTETLRCKKSFKNENNEWIATDEVVDLPAQTILVATGTQPNIAYEFEHKGTFNRLNLQYQHYEEIDHELQVAHGVTHCKDPQFGPFTSYHKHDKRVSLIGDTHPVFHGNVVKAIASGMRTYPKILALFADKTTHVGDVTEYQQFRKQICHHFMTKVESIKRLATNVIELKIHAPIAVKHYQPGQFYRLQNFETASSHVEKTLLQMEPISLTPAACDFETHTLTFLVNEHNASQKLCALLKKGEPVSLMGPTGIRAKIPKERETVLIIGDQASFPFLRTYGTLLRENKNHVTYIGLLNKAEEAYCLHECENATDQILWQVTQGTLIKTTRPQDFSLCAESLVTTLTSHANELSLRDVDRIYLIGNTSLLKTFQAARNTLLKPYLVKEPKVYGAVYGNMQCMLKGVCAQCLQWQIDPETQKRTKAVFACSWQDQPLEIIDVNHIDERAMQNHLHDQLSTLWVDHIFKQHNLSTV